MPTVVDAVARGSFVVVTHPGFLGIPSFGKEAIDDMAYHLPDNIKKYVGLEEKNFHTQIMPWPLNLRREMLVRNLADKHNFARFGGSDAHDGNKQIGRVTTHFPSSMDLMTAIVDRQVYPFVEKGMGWGERGGNWWKVGWRLVKKKTNGLRGKIK